MSDGLGFLSSMESDEERDDRWGRDVVGWIKQGLTDARGLKIHSRPTEWRIALYAALKWVDAYQAVADAAMKEAEEKVAAYRAAHPVSWDE